MKGRSIAWVLVLFYAPAEIADQDRPSTRCTVDEILNDSCGLLLLSFLNDGVCDPVQIWDRLRGL